MILNIWTLWLFGQAVEDRLGHARYLAFYLVCGVIASVTHAAFNPTSSVPALGASGAIAGVLGCYVRLFPLARLIVMVPIFLFFVEVPAGIFAGLWFLMQVLQGTVELFKPYTGVVMAWWAHVAGFVAGLVLVPLLRQPTPNYRRYYADEGVLRFNPRGHR